MPTILIVDDDELDRELATRCLNPIEDLTVEHAQDGGEALQVVARQRPDLVLTDLRMPGMDGLELVGAICEDYPSVPVILMTSKGSEPIAVRALKAGAASYVPKSDLKHDLVGTVLQVLDVSAVRLSRERVVRYLRQSETHFDLANDPALISPLVGFLQDGLERIGFARPSTRTQIGMALTEALSNAMIHGNLEVTSELRDRDSEDYYRLIEERRAQPPYADRQVHCTAKESPDRVDYIIADEGPGFDTSAPGRNDPIDDLTRVRGRGLLLIRTFMDVVEHNARGNRITLTKHSPRPVG